MGDIETDCPVAPRFWMKTGEVHSIVSLDTDTQLNPGKPVRVGNHVRIADQATLLIGSLIPNNAIAGVRAVVTGVIAGTVRPPCVAAGNPARIVRENVTERWNLI